MSTWWGHGQLTKMLKCIFQSPKALKTVLMLGRSDRKDTTNIALKHSSAYTQLSN